MKKCLFALITFASFAMLFGCGGANEAQLSNDTVQQDEVAEKTVIDNDTTNVALSLEEQELRLKAHLNFLSETYETIKTEFENQKNNYNEDIWIAFVNDIREKVKQKRNEFDSDFSPAVQKAPNYFDEVVLINEIYTTLEVTLIKEMFDYLDDGSGEPKTPMNQIETSLGKINL